MPRKKQRHSKHDLERSVQILLAEDCLGDVVLVRKALESIQVPTRLTVVEDGEQLLHYLVNALKLEDPESDLPFPDVVLVDLNMPKLDGFKALELIAEQNGCRHLPLVVISSTANPDDRRLAKALGADGFIDKALGPEAIIQQLQFIERLWLEPATMMARPSPRHH